MRNMFLLSVVVAFTFTVHTGLQASNCNDQKYITIDDPRRSTAYNSFNSSKICDRTIIRDDVWYRFSSEAGGIIPTTMPKIESCGTYGPIWLNGSHPSVEDGAVTRKACANVPIKSPFGCGYSYNIRVRNCSGYYIYQLKKPSICSFAYCAGSKLLNCTNTDPGDYCLKNRPPYFTMSNRYYVLKNSEFQLVYNATDPEGYPMSYSYMASKTINSTSVDQKQKFLKASLKESQNITLNVRDYGDLKAMHTVEIITIPCSCHNGGKCYNQKSISTEREDISNFKCDCAKPYTGQWCEVSPCDKLPCFSGVGCSVMGESYKCKQCPTRYEGDGKDCQLIFTDDLVVVEAELTIISGLKWNTDLLNKTSLFHKQQSLKIITQITKAYEDTKEFLNVAVTRYREGSVVVQFQVALKENLDDPLMPIRAHASKDNFGIFVVDPNSVKEENLTEVIGTLNVLSGLKWKDDLLDTSSHYFKTTSFKVANQINNIYADEKDFLYVFVTSFRKKNPVVEVEFKLVWRNKIKDPLNKLQEETKDGKLGEISIDTDSVKIKPSNDPNDPSYFGLHKAVFIVLVCIVSFLVIASMVVCVVYIRKKHISIVMLTTNDDQHGFCPNNSGQNSQFEMKKPPSRNQVVDLKSVQKGP